MAHVLVVEDEKDSRDFVAQYLKREGHSVDTAVDGATALRKLLNERVDLVVLDVRMPRMDGLGLLESSAPTSAGTRSPSSSSPPAPPPRK